MVDIECYECEQEDEFDSHDDAIDEGWKKVKGHWLCPDCVDTQEDEEKADSDDEDEDDDDDDDNSGFGGILGEFGGASFGGGGGTG